MSVSALLDDWRAEAERLRRRGLRQAAEIVDSLGDELEERLRDVRVETVNLTQAARLSGYTAGYLGELVKQGKIPNAGRANAPRIRLSDVPRKAGCGTKGQGIGVELVS